MLIKLRFLKKTFEYEGQHIIPAPKVLAKEITNALATGPYKTHTHNKQDIVNRLSSYLATTVPIYNIPTHTIKDGVVNMDSNTIYVKYKSIMPSYFRESIDVSLPIAFALFNQPCVLELCKEDEIEEFTHFSAIEGIKVEAASDIELHYAHVDELERLKPEPLIRNPQRLTFSVTPAVDISETLSFLNSLHRRLIRLSPNNHQTLGSYGNTITSDEESLFLRLVDENTVTIECATGITQSLVEAVSTPFVGIFFDERTEYTFTLTKNEHYEEKKGHHHVSIIPSFINYKLKADRPEIDQAFTGLFRSINFQMNGPVPHEAEIIRVGEWGKTNVKGIGEIIARLIPCESPFSSRRGGRGVKNEASYQVELITQERVVIRGIGTSRRFGAGVLDVVG